MKFDWNGRLSFKDSEGDRLAADVYLNSADCFLYILVNGGRAVRMTREEARKFAKAIRKEVKRTKTGNLD